MVFCGKPSKGCLGCRKRRIKCDQIRPACSQCMRVSKKCEGYRDQLDISFRNENEKIVHKAKRQPTPSQTTVAKHQEGGINVHISLEQTQALLLAYTSPPTPSLQSHNLFEDQGVYFFFTSFSTLLLDDNSPGKPRPLAHRIIPPSEIYENVALFNAISSVGFAGLGNITKDKQYTILARKRFASALTTVKTALKKLQGADLESIFKAVILFSAFHIISDSPNSQQDWSIHVEGGAALLQQMEAKKSRDIPIRQQLKLCLSVFGKYIHKKEPCSPSILAWFQKCADLMEPNDQPAIALTRLLIRFVDLNAAIGHLGSMDSSALIAEVIELDAQMELWEKEIPESWHYTDPTIITECDAYGHSHETLNYRDIWTARIWNDYRCSRISVNDLIVRHTYKTEFMLTADAAQVCRSIQINIRMAKGICNSIACGFETTPKFMASGNLLLLQPLTVAASGVGVPEDVHQAALRRLLSMGTVIGLGQALDLAEKAKIQRQDWKLMLDDWID